MDKKLYDKRKEQLGEISVSIAKVNSRLATASDEQLEAIAKELVSLTKQKDILIASLRVMLQQERQEQETAREAAKLKVAKPRLERIAWLREPGHEPSCPECGSPGKLVENIQNPVIVGGLGDPNARVTFAYRCENPDIAKGKHRFWLNLDEIEEKKELRKKSSSAGAILKVVSKASTND